MASKILSISNTPTSTRVLNECGLRPAYRKQVVLSWSPILNVFLKGNTSSSPDIVLKGSFLQYDFNIATSSGRVLAEVSRKLSTKEFLDTQTYYVRIKPNVDMALVIGLVSMADNIFVNTED
ncbi:hypothetical protein CLOM_g23568 [Closterium sp. NIES-68]|nr:hypothetical protein CLOM_g23568 [Closterium sp. NIES-68]